MKYISFIIISSCLVACRQNQKTVSVPYYNKPDFTPVWSASGDMHTVPGFSFINQDSAVITEKSTEGKIYLVNFFFTTCSGICPRMTETLLRVNERYKNDTGVMIISHTVDPETDQPRKLKAFAAQYNITNPNWQFVTGDKDSIYTLARKGYFIEQAMGFDKTTNEFLHSENIILIDKNKHIRGIYNGTVLPDAGRMIEDIGELKKEN